MNINLDSLDDLVFENKKSGYCCSPTGVRLSFHALQRFRERTDMADIDQINNFVDDAIKWGRNINSYNGMYRQFMLEKAAHGCWPVTYRGLLLMISPDRTTIVTVYPLPYWFFNELTCCNTSQNHLLEWGSRCLSRFRNLCSHFSSEKRRDSWKENTNEV